MAIRQDSRIYEILTILWSDAAMRNCHICGEEARDEARYCRSCYAVFADVDQAVAAGKKKTRTMTYIIRALVLLGVVGGAWLSRVDLAIFPESGPVGAQVSTNTSGGPEKQARSAPTSAVSSSGSGAGMDSQRGRPVNVVAASSVQRLDTGCAISQAVHNNGERIMFPVTLDFSFEDIFGQRVGKDERGVVEVILPAGERRGFTFELPCPKAFAQVRIHATDGQTGISGSGAVDEVAKLIAGQPLIDARRLHVVIEAPSELVMCPEFKPCQLMLYFNDSWIAVWFRRDPNNPDTLIASDPQLVGPLQQGWNADIRLPLRHGTEKMTVTQEYLREPQRTGGWAALKASVGKLFGTKEKGE
jgi:hypothetical protein